MNVANQTIMIGSAGTATSYGIIRSLLAAWPRLTLVASDANPAELVVASQFVKHYVQAPLARQREAYAAHLLETIARFQVNVFVPVHDEEIAVVAELAESGRWPSEVKLTAPSSATVKFCNDKLSTAEVLDRNHMPTPKTLAIAAAVWQQRGWFAKPRFGIGSVGVRLVDSEDELKKLQATAPDFIVQDLCERPEFTIDSFVSRNGRIICAVARERLEVKAGVCVKARISQNPVYTQMARQIAAAFGLTGAFCFQIMHTESGKPTITDVNPRTGGATRMCAALGVNFPAANIADILGLDVGVYLPALKGMHVVLRQHEEFVMSYASGL